MVHQVGHTGHRLDLHTGRPEAVDEGPVDLGRRRHGDYLGVVLVEHEADGDAALHRGTERVEQRGPGRLLEAEVVDRDVQRLLRVVEEGCDALGHPIGGLSAVGDLLHPVLQLNAGCKVRRFEYEVEQPAVQAEPGDGQGVE